MPDSTPPMERASLAEGPAGQYMALIESGVIEFDHAQARAVDRLEKLHAALEGYRYLQRKGLFARLRRQPEPPKGLYIYGDVGRGKSMLMDMFFDTAPMKAKRRVHFHDFMQETHERIHAWRRKLERKNEKDADPIAPAAKRIARQAQLLCFDEFQVSDITDAMILGRLFTTLFEEGVVVVATSNRPPGRLYEDGLNRQLFLPFIGLLEARLEILCLDAAMDYRLDRLKGHPVYHTPLGPEADAAMAADWRRLTHTDKGAPAKLEVKGRKLLVPETARGIARFSFDELCGKALGAADYLAIARTFHTVLIDGIPRMSPARRNEAKRFVVLIDALYENKVKLICSAEAPPGELYPEGDDAFEFTRAASRLVEMQSAGYLALGHAV